MVDGDLEVVLILKIDMIAIQIEAAIKLHLVTRSRPS